MIASRRAFFGMLAAPAILRVTKPMALWTPKPLRVSSIGIDYGVGDKSFAALYINGKFMQPYREGLIEALFKEPPLFNCIYQVKWTESEDNALA